MFPIRDENPHFLTPVASVGLIVVNVAVWIFLEGLGSAGPLTRSVCELGLVPAEILGRIPPGTVYQLTHTKACMLGVAPAWYTPLTSMFLHGGWMHLLGNMWFLWIFGNNVEDSMGPLRFLVFYLLCGLVAAALQVLLAPDSLVPMVGASGAIGGVMGAYIVLYPRVRVHLLVFLGFYVTTIAVPAAFMLGYWFLLQLAGGAMDFGSPGSGVAFWAHVGGFLAGMGLVFVFRDRQLLARHPYHGGSGGAAGRRFERLRG